MASPVISILLPTWNGEADLARLLPVLAAQREVGEVEILATDSSSEDGSVALLRAAGAEVTVIEQAEFGHGKTRNQLAARARGELLVFLSQDVLPADERFLAELVAPFEDPEVVGVYSRVLPHAEDDPLTARTVLDAPEAREEGRTACMGAENLWESSPEERAASLRFNNVASAVRASFFAEVPFPDVPFGEDFAWAARALTRGRKICFAPRSVAHHAHRYTARQAFERYSIDAAFHREIHGHRLRPSLLSVLRGLAYEVREDVRFVRGRRVPGGLRHLLRSPALRGAQVLGQFWGSQRWGRRFWPAEDQGSVGSGR